MKIRDVMTKRVSFCGLDTTLAAAAGLMRKSACGFLPVVGEGGNVIGVLTDRDICLALGTLNRKASEVAVQTVMRPRLFTCTPEDDVRSALKTMHIERVRRLPVIDRNGAPVGVLSMDDIVLRAREHALKKDVSYKNVAYTYQAISGQAGGRKKPPRAAA